MRDADDADFVRTALGKGLTHRAVAYRHSLPAAVSPTVAFAGAYTPLLVANALLVEQVFNIPGVFRYTTRRGVERRLPAAAGDGARRRGAGRARQPDRRPGARPDRPADPNSVVAGQVVPGAAELVVEAVRRRVGGVGGERRRVLAPAPAVAARRPRRRSARRRAHRSRQSGRRRRTGGLPDRRACRRSRRRRRRRRRPRARARRCRPPARRRTATGVPSARTR